MRREREKDLATVVFNIILALFVGFINFGVVNMGMYMFNVALDTAVSDIGIQLLAIILMTAFVNYVLFLRELI